jgi:hypothetical protein
MIVQRDTNEASSDTSPCPLPDRGGEGTSAVILAVGEGFDAGELGGVIRLGRQDKGLTTWADRIHSEK